MLKSIVDEETKQAVYGFLLAIAASDQAIAPEEQALLKTIASDLGLTGAGVGVNRSA